MIVGCAIRSKSGKGKQKKDWQINQIHDRFSIHCKNFLQHKQKLQTHTHTQKKKAKIKTTIMSKISVSQSYQSSQVIREGDK